ncbi:hypothetical protein AVEN_264989-1 [Araneus ventricosus]|uniref:Uncharacterized protein n=1 Tax=Araneus ventricosus TaxID=182803 RepID=A0A4Y2ENU8_ARAVE|nr:hypothetical protein AVEN_264989-1 [Araneus ventricosus]
MEISEREKDERSSDAGRGCQTTWESIGGSCHQTAPFCAVSLRLAEQEDVNLTSQVKTFLVASHFLSQRPPMQCVADIEISVTDPKDYRQSIPHLNASLPRHSDTRETSATCITPKNH